MRQDALIAIGGGLLSAVAAMTFLSGTPLAFVVVFLAPVPLLMVGLGLGPRAATVSGAVGFFATGLIGGLYSAGVYGLLHALPAWTVAKLVMLRRTVRQDETPGATEWYPPGAALSALALLGAVFLLLAAFNVGVGDFETMVASHLSEISQVMLPTLDDEGREGFASLMTPWFPGAVVVSWVMMSVLNAVIAQGILVRMERNLRPSPAYAALELPAWMSWPLVIAATAALAGPAIGSDGVGYLARNTAMVVAVPYFFLGLAVIHTLARRVAQTGLVLIALYVVVLMSGWAAVVVAGVGVTEQWIGLRDRSKAGKGGTPPEDADE